MLKSYFKPFLYNKTYLRHLNTTHTPAKQDKRWPGWEVVIGLEVHTQIKSRAKLFSDSWSSGYDEPPNSHVNAFDASYPGVLPKLNSTCVDMAIRTAIALNADIQLRSSFDRKHYFYSDLPSGYQITQQYAPIAKNGHLKLQNHGTSVNIKQIQLEQDTAKSTFDPQTKQTFIDLNRSGTALMEIVSEPDMSSPEQAGEYVKSLQELLRAIGVSDGNMEQGSLRCDVNVSVNRIGEPKGIRCEIKNLNSIRFMTTAIISEALRHISLLEEGKSVAQETRGFDEHSAETYCLRSKEDAPDYRYMPDPNLPPLLINEQYVNSIKESMPELPSETRSRLLAMGLSARDADFLMTIDSGRDIDFDGNVKYGYISFFEDVARHRDPKVAFNWVTHDLYGLLLSRKETFKDRAVTATHLRYLIDLVESKKITGASGKVILKRMQEQPSAKLPLTLAEELNLLALDENVDDTVNKLCIEAIDRLPEESEAVRKGNLRVLNKLVGYIMKSSKGRVDAQIIQTRLKEILTTK